jgi:hypothetical protein
MNEEEFMEYYSELLWKNFVSYIEFESDYGGMFVPLVPLVELKIN